MINYNAISSIGLTLILLLNGKFLVLRTSTKLFNGQVKNVNHSDLIALHTKNFS